MATVTKHMVHFENAADGFIELEGKASGFAEELFNGLVVLAAEYKGNELTDKFDETCLAVENARKPKLVEITGDETMTMTKYSAGWKVRKSELRRGIKVGLDPTKYDTFTSFRKAIDKAVNKNVSGKSTGGGAPDKSGGADSSKGDSAGNTNPTLHPVTNSLPKSVAEKLNLIAKHLAELDEKAALEILTNCDGAIHARLKKVGGRFGNVKKKTG